MQIERKFDDIVKKVLESTGTGRQALEEMAEQRLAVRASTVDQIRRLKAEGHAARPTLQAAIAKANRILQDARQKVLECEQAAQAAAKAHATENYRVSHGIEVLEQQLRGTADLAIQSFIDELNEAHDRFRHRGNASTHMLGRTRDGVAVKAVDSTYCDVEQRLMAIREARQQAELLKLEVGTNVPERLAELRRRSLGVLGVPLAITTTGGA